MKKTLLALTLAFATTVYAACPQLYPNATEIAVPNTVELCNSFFVIRFNTANKATVLVAETLTKGSKVGSAERVNAFHSDPRVGKSSAVNGDYTGTGYDKGHMAPAGDASSADQMNETFLLTNMTPQKPTLNRLAWKVLEEKVRKQFAAENTEFKIVNVALYNKPTDIGNHIPVPSGYWKFVIHGGKTDAYFAENKDNAPVTLMPNVDMTKVIANASGF